MGPHGNWDKRSLDWVATVAHDLRQPAGVIEMSTEILARLHPGEPTAEERQAFERLRAATERIKRLTHDLLDLGLIESGRFRVRTSALDLSMLILEVVATTPAETCTLRTQLPRSMPPIEADADRIEQVLRNLISNAIKYGEPHNEVAIEAVTAGEMARVTVTNKGQIRREMVPRLFAPYQRGDATDSRGTGLGLYIAKTIVEAHGGGIWVEGAQDETKFCFTLPHRRGGAPVTPA